MRVARGLPGGACGLDRVGWWRFGFMRWGLRHNRRDPGSPYGRPSLQSSAHYGCSGCIWGAELEAPFAGFWAFSWCGVLGAGLGGDGCLRAVSALLVLVAFGLSVLSLEWGCLGSAEFLRYGGALAISGHFERRVWAHSCGSRIRHSALIRGSCAVRASSSSWPAVPYRVCTHSWLSWHGGCCASRGRRTSRAVVVRVLLRCILGAVLAVGLGARCVPALGRAWAGMGCRVVR